MQNPASLNLSALRPGQHVLVDGRVATFVYHHPHGDAVVVRYDGDTDSRAVSLRKIQLLPDPPAG